MSDHDDFEFYDEPIDDSVWGLEKIDKPCPQCGSQLRRKEMSIQGILEVDEVCVHCDYGITFYED